MTTNAAEMSWDDIKALFRETDRKFQETEAQVSGDARATPSQREHGFDACDRPRARW